MALFKLTGETMSDAEIIKHVNTYIIKSLNEPLPAGVAFAPDPPVLCLEDFTRAEDGSVSFKVDVSELSPEADRRFHAHAIEHGAQVTPVKTEP